VLELQNLPTPRTWTDLANPAFASWVGSADPRQSGSAHMAYEIILQAHGGEKGWQTITAMGANIKTFSRLASDVPKDAALGEIACGPCIDSYAYAQMAFSGSDVLGYVMPEGLTVVNPEGIGILRGAPNLKVAEMFLDFVMSNQGQRLLMAPIGKHGGPQQFRISRMSVHPRLYDQLGENGVVPVNPFQMKSTLTFDSAKSSKRWKLLNDLIGVFLVENHDGLCEAWKAMSASGPDRRAALLERLGAMPLSEQEALELVPKVRDNPVARNEAMLEWSRFARRKYDAVIRETK
jgi:spermidine/putrescine-binding protein